MNNYCTWFTARSHKFGRQNQAGFDSDDEGNSYGYYGGTSYSYGDADGGNDESDDDDDEDDEEDDDEDETSSDSDDEQEKPDDAGAKK